MFTDSTELTILVTSCPSLKTVAEYLATVSDSIESESDLNTITIDAGLCELLDLPQTSSRLDLAGHRISGFTFSFK